MYQDGQKRTKFLVLGSGLERYEGDLTASSCGELTKLVGAKGGGCPGWGSKLLARVVADG